MSRGPDIRSCGRELTFVRNVDKDREQVVQQSEAQHRAKAVEGLLHDRTYHLEGDSRCESRLHVDWNNLQGYQMSHSVDVLITQSHTFTRPVLIVFHIVNIGLLAIDNRLDIVVTFGPIVH